MVSQFSSVRCLECGHQHGADLALRNCVVCRSQWLDAQYDYAAVGHHWFQQLKNRPTNLWRYQELLPVTLSTNDLTLGEGWTPLITGQRLAKDLELTSLWIKDERQQPTGSFKDRQAAVTVQALARAGVQEIVLASTGNAAAAYAAFCARADIKLWVFLTGSVPAEKTRELALYGAEVVKITDTYDQAKKIAANFAERRGIYFDSGARSIVGKESMKTIAYEIVEQMGGIAPDWYVQAVSGAIGPLGVHKGFVELYNLGIIDRVPKLGIIQVDGCAPMAQAWERGARVAAPVEPDTLISVLATGDPGYAYQLLSGSLLATGGAMTSVSDGEAFRAMRRVARTEGLSVEPATAVAFAGLEKLIQLGHVHANEKVVVNCSGHTFSAEKHALEDRYFFHLETENRGGHPAARAKTGPLYHEGLAAALQQLDEQVTTIVIIDDNPHDSRLIRRLLQSHKNYRVFEATNGPDGLDLVRQRQPDLVVLDLTLPDMDGFSILEALKRDQRTHHIPVMIVSAKSLTPEENEWLLGQSDSIWQKGNFSARELLDHVLARLGSDHTRPGLEKSSTDASERMHPTLHWQAHSQAVAKPRILIVDDNMLDARLLRRMFEARQQFEVVEAYSGEHALACIEDKVPDLLILDLMLPDIKGEILLNLLRDRDDTRVVPVIVVSAKMLDARLRAQLVAQADSIWEKGVMDRNSLLLHIETMLTP